MSKYSLEKTDDYELNQEPSDSFVQEEIIRSKIDSNCDYKTLLQNNSYYQFQLFNIYLFYVLKGKCDLSIVVSFYFDSQSNKAEQGAFIRNTFQIYRKIVVKDQDIGCQSLLIEKKSIDVFEELYNSGLLYEPVQNLMRITIFENRFLCEFSSYDYSAQTQGFGLYELKLDADFQDNSDIVFDDIERLYKRVRCNFSIPLYLNSLEQIIQESWILKFLRSYKIIVLARHLVDDTIYESLVIDVL